MNRRDFVKAIAGAASALILPPTVEENAEEARRIWALGAMPKAEPGPTFLAEIRLIGSGGIRQVARHDAVTVTFAGPRLAYTHINTLRWQQRIDGGEWVEKSITWESDDLPLTADGGIVIPKGISSVAVGF